MIEIEKKFLLTDAQRQALLQDAEPLGKKQVTDSYLDTQDYTLTTADYWFRERNGAYELKAPLKSGNGSSATNRYNEITNIEEIRQELRLASGDFETVLAQAGIARFVTVYTDRTSYEKDGFHLDLDSARYENSSFEYAVAEIELLIESEDEAEDAETKIVEFAKQFSLTTDAIILGKVAAFLKAEKPDHYQVLVEAGVFK